VSCFLHKDQDPDALLAGIRKTAPVPLDDAEIEFVEGYSRPGSSSRSRSRQGCRAG
jgi:hypothetical protein